MRIGFYSPLKSPYHPVPSGDRAMARAIMQIMRDLGHDVQLICNLRTFDRGGSHQRQVRLRELSIRAAELLEKRGLRFDLLFTYHVYHKAPDWLGPILSNQLGIPYVIAEPSIAGKQAGGRWHLGHYATLAALARADHVFAITDIDHEAVESHVGAKQQLSILRPFVPIPDTPANHSLKRCPRILSVAMMRDDVKKLSYHMLADALYELQDLDWQLSIVGSGPAEPEIRSWFQYLGDRVNFLGFLEPAELALQYRGADVLAWPGLNEAYGMVFLEAQSFALPVVAFADGGVPEVVKHGHTGLLCKNRDTSALAASLRKLLTRQEMRSEMGKAARQMIIQRHSIDIARQAIGEVLKQLPHNA